MVYQIKKVDRSTNLTCDKLGSSQFMATIQKKWWNSWRTQKARPRGYTLSTKLGYSPYIMWQIAYGKVRQQLRFQQVLPLMFLWFIPKQLNHVNDNLCHFPMFCAKRGLCKEAHCIVSLCISRGKIVFILLSNCKRNCRIFFIFVLNTFLVMVYTTVYVWPQILQNTHMPCVYMKVKNNPYWEYTGKMWWAQWKIPPQNTIHEKTISGKRNGRNVDILLLDRYEGSTWNTLKEAC